MKKKILMLVAPTNYRDIEYIVPKAFFEQHRYDTITTSLQATAVGRYGYIATVDTLIADAQHYSALYMVGGGGSSIFEQDATTRYLVSDFFAQQKPVAAICAAPRCLLAWGLLANKKMTGWNGDGLLPDLAAQHSAIYTGHTVEIDEYILTADGASASEESAIGLMGML
jgi:putative intracellular protease/amidase